VRTNGADTKAIRKVRKCSKKINAKIAWCIFHLILFYKQGSTQSKRNRV